MYDKTKMMLEWLGVSFRAVQKTETEIANDIDGKPCAM